MSNRNFNVFFNTHTVSGIVISVALYIIFFAGAFALFKEEIQAWEEGNPVSYTERKNINFDKILNNLDSQYELTGRDVQAILGKDTDQIYVYMGASKDSLASEKGKTPDYTYIHITNGKTNSYPEQYSLGEFLYRLHFFYQFPYGIYLAGLVSFFFLFAIVTGVIVHWKKIIPSFFNFNPKVALKRVWADAHTALGIIGLPFQFIFAVSGTYLAIGILVLFASNLTTNKQETETFYPENQTYTWEKASEKTAPNFNVFMQRVTAKWPDFIPARIYVKNYGGATMKYIATGELHDSNRFVGLGKIIYHTSTDSLDIVKNPNTFSYTQELEPVVRKLHFANFGGLYLKITYFFLAFITCFVIITGVLVWVESRNKKSMTLRQRQYTAKVGHIFLAICLTLLPVTALSFVFVKLCNGYFENKQQAIYIFFFVSWFVSIVYFRFKRDNYKTNKSCLLLGAIFGFLVPLVNGIVSGNWIWNSYLSDQKGNVLVDLLWLIIASISLVAFFKIKPNIQQQSSFNKLPVEYPKNHSFNQQIDYNNKNLLIMKLKISSLWIFIAIGYIFHHIYGLASVYFTQSVFIEGSTGETPMWAHQWRILMEGLALAFGLLTIELSKKGFIITSLIWAVIVGIFNVYHIITAFLYEPGNYSELFILFLLVVASLFLVSNLLQWKKSLE